MASEYLTAPALVTHVFLAVRHPDGWARLRSLWHDVTTQLRLDRPIPSLAPLSLPAEPAIPVGGAGLLAAADSGRASVWQASAWADHDIGCLTVMMAPPPSQDCASAWLDLESVWAEVTAGLPAQWALGQARIFLALLARPAGDAPSRSDGMKAQALGLIRAALQAPPGSGWWRHWDAIPIGPRDDDRPEVMIWESGPDADEGRDMRRLAVLAPVQSEGLVDHFLWTDGVGSPAPLTRHLMHAARLRRQIRVFGDGQASGDIRHDLATILGRLPAGHLPGEPLARRELAGQVIGPGRLSDRLERGYAAALVMRGKLDELQGAVAVIDDNMRGALDLPDAQAAVGPLSADRDLASWFGQRIGDELTRLDTAIRNAQRAREFLASQAPPLARQPDRAAGNGRRSASPPRPRAQRAGDLRQPWVVIFTAIEAEYTAIKDCLDGPAGEQEERGTIYELGELPGARQPWRIALTQTGPGGTNAGVQLERAVPLFSPEIVLFLGVAGGRKEVGLGDVVVADKIYDYESGKWAPGGFLPRIRTHSPAHGLLQRSRQIARGTRWHQRISPQYADPGPASFIKPIATGCKVISDDRSAVADFLGQYADDAVAVDMEGHGFLEGAHVNSGVDALVIRGISDLLTGKDPVNDDYWQPVASRHVAAFAVELLASIGSNRS